LRARRAEAPDGLVDRICATVDDAEARRPRSWSRLAFACGMSVFVLGTFASFGGLSYAASGANGTYHALSHAVATHKLAVSVHSSAADQYPHAVKPAKVVKTKPKHAAVIGKSGTLPFTGFSLLTTLLLSFALIGGGIVLRRRERRE
jgi:hypothetical protein